MTDEAFGRAPPLSLGVEEEVGLLDAQTLAPAPVVEALLRDAEGVALPGRLKTEFFASVVELNTHRCDTAEEAGSALRALRRAAADLAGRQGAVLAASGSHPTSRAEEQAIVPEPRYLDFVEYAGVSARRQGVNGLHVHVSMPSPQVGLHVLEGILPWLPVLLAVSANSPYWAGEETGLLSNRAEILAQLPRSGPPPRFESFAEWRSFMHRFAAAGLPLTSDYTTFWWDVRLHPRFGTLEVRMPDQPTSVALSAALVALVQVLCATMLRRPPRPLQSGDRAVYRQNRWAALRFGPAALLVHPEESRAVTAAELADELLALAAPEVSELGLAPLLEPLDPGRCEAERQLEVGRREGLRAVSADVARRTVDGLASMT